MTNVFQVVFACMLGVSLGSSGEHIGAHRRPSNPARANVRDRNLFIPLPMVRNVRKQPDSDGHYELDVETADGVRRTEVGGMDDDGNNQVKGVIQYILPDGTPFFLRYIADETGFHPQGNMLPTPPPMPAHSLLQMKNAGKLHHSSEENAMFDSMENDPMFKSMEDMFRSMENDDLSDSPEINTFKHKNLITGQITRFDSIEDGFHSIEDRFDSVEDRFNSREDRFDSIEDKFHSKEDRFDSREDKYDSVEGRFDSIEDRFDSREDRFDSREDRFDSKEDRFDSRENKRAPARNKENSRGLLRNITNRGGAVLRNKNTGKIVLLRNGRVIDSFESDSIENKSNENDSLEFNVKLSQSFIKNGGRLSTRG